MIVHLGIAYSVAKTSSGAKRIIIGATYEAACNLLKLLGTAAADLAERNVRGASLTAGLSSIATATRTHSAKIRNDQSGETRLTRSRRGKRDLIWFTHQWNQLVQKHYAYHSGEIFIDVSRQIMEESEFLN